MFNSFGFSFDEFKVCGHAFLTNFPYNCFSYGL